MKMYQGVDVFLTSALVGSEWSASRLCREEALGTHWLGGWVGPRAGLDDVTPPGRELRPHGRPARSQPRAHK
jgi:hypothetical protein